MSTRRLRDLAIRQQPVPQVLDRRGVAIRPGEWCTVQLYGSWHRGRVIKVFHTRVLIEWLPVHRARRLSYVHGSQLELDSSALIS